MLVAIEGLAGAGKTTIAKKIAKKLEFDYFGRGITINSQEGVKAKVCEDLLLLKEVVAKAAHRNIIVDDGFLEMYFNNFLKDNKKISSTVMEECAKPDLVIILHADVESRINRMALKDLEEVNKNINKFFNNDYSMIIDFVEKKDLTYIVIETVGKSEEEVLNECINAIVGKEKTKVYKKKLINNTK